MGVTITSSGSAIGGSVVFVAHLHASRCSVLPPGGAHYLQNTSLPDDALAPPVAAGSSQGTNTMSLRVSPANVSSSATQPWLVDYDRALSVVLHEPSAAAGYSPTAAGARFACCNLAPNLPDFPTTWSATIEANFGKGRAYTMTRQEFYSQDLNKVAIVQHTNMARTVEVQHLSTNTLYSLSQNATYPYGVCVQSAIGSGPQNAMMASNGQLKSTESFLQFSPDQPISFDGTNVVNVRGISCERWSRNYSFSFGPGESSNGTATYAFPVSTWNNRGESYHRLIKRVEVVGTHYSARTGNRDYTNSYEFVNFVPAVTNLDVFDPCFVLQMGPLGTTRNYSVTGCGCETRPGMQAPPRNTNGGVPSASGKMYGPGSMAAVGIIVPLITLALGAAIGICMERKARRRMAPDMEEVGLTSSGAS